MPKKELPKLAIKQSTKAGCQNQQAQCRERKERPVSPPEMAFAQTWSKPAPRLANRPICKNRRCMLSHATCFVLERRVRAICASPRRHKRVACLRFMIDVTALAELRVETPREGAI